jgi:hypothetical protein
VQASGIFRSRRTSALERFRISNKKEVMKFASESPCLTPKVLPPQVRFTKWLRKLSSAPFAPSHVPTLRTLTYRWPTVPARHGTGTVGTVGTASNRVVPRSAVVPRLWHGHGPTTAPSCRAVPRGTRGTIVLSRGGRRAGVSGRLHARRLGAEGGERTTAACATASGAVAYATTAGQELRASGAGTAGGFGRRG